MKKTFALVLFASFSFQLSAQQTKRSVLYNMVNEKINSGKQLTPLTMFSPLKTGIASTDTVVRQFVKLTLNRSTLLTAVMSKPELISIAIPFGNKQFVLKLSRQPINTSGDFVFGIIENGIRKKISADEGLNYRGYINDDSSSLACVSIFENGDVMCLFCNREGNFNIGQMSNAKDEYVLYKDNDMIAPPRLSCSFDQLAENETKLQDLTSPILAPLPNPMATPSILCNKVRLYWEADNSLYADNFGSNLTNIKNYITGVFNEVAAVYEDEGLQVELSESFVWTTPDPYSRTSSSSAVTSFRSHWNSLGNNFNGDYAHLLAGNPGNNGGVAYLLNSTCSRSYSYGYSNVYGNYQNFPAYSWDVYVLSHETGHNLGSYHTQWCGWKTGAGGSCGSIDNCYTQENFDTCATCFTTTDIAAPPPQFKGTIMSYCHLVSGIGIDLSNGFGPLPQAVIRNTVSNGSCLLQGNSWTGAVSTAWENAGNWSCGVVPTSTTDVTITDGLTNYPQINSTTAVCHAITLTGNATLKVNAGFKLNVTGLSH